MVPFRCGPRGGFGTDTPRVGSDGANSRESRHVRILLAGAARSPNVCSFIEPMASRGHEIHVATLHAGSLPGATVHELGRSGRGWSRLAFLGAIRSFRSLHRSLKPDLTLGYYASSYGVLTTFVSPPRVVVTAGSDILREAQSSALRRALIPRIAGFALRRADLVLCWAPHLAEAAVDRGAPASRVMTLPRGIDVTTFAPGRDEVAGPPRIISTRFLAPFYRPEILLDAFLELRDRQVSAKLEFVADGPSMDALRARCANSPHRADIMFPGRLGRADLAERLRTADVYAGFPKSEGVSASLLEAMACGLVPVVTDLSANRDWIDPNVNGILVPEPVTVSSVCEALVRALRDGDLRARARELNVNRVRDRADRSRNALRFEEAFLRLVASRRVGA